MAESELVQLKVKVPETLRRDLKVLAAKLGRPMNELATLALTVLVQRKGITHGHALGFDANCGTCQREATEEGRTP